MRIVIDMQGAQTGSRFRGIGRYTMSLTKAIVRNRGAHEIVLALNGLIPDTIEPIRAAFDNLLPQENIRVWHAPGPVRECETGNNWRREIAECIREAFLASLRPDLVYVPSLFEGFSDDAITSVGAFAPQIPTIVTIHDLIPLLNPELYLNTNQLYALYYKRKIMHLKRANQWLAVSESSAGEGRDVLKFPAESVIITGEGCDSAFRRLEISEVERKQLLTRFCITRPFVLCSGGADAHKNLHRLIRSYARLPKILHDNHQLVLPGKIYKGGEAELRLTAEVAGISEDKLLFTGYVTDKELAQLYNLCAVFVFPSYHEGFGLPALEAMSCGAAVIGANTTSLPEVIGRQDALFDPYDEGAICRKLAQALGDEAFRSALAAHGLEQARKFSWDKSAKRAIASFEKLHSVKATNSQVFATENILSRLIKTIAVMVPSSINSGEMRSIAHMLNRNHTGSSPRQLLVDISELVQRDARTGIQRVTRSILKELLANPPEGYVVAPVYSTPDGRGYSYAYQFTARFRSVASYMDDEPIDYHPGDIFLGLDLQHQVVIAQKDYLEELRRNGVKVFFVVHDLLPITFPHYFLSGAAKDHKEWLLALACFDGVICISRTVAEEFTKWIEIHGQYRLRQLKISWSHSGADIANSVPTIGLPDEADQVLKKLACHQTFLTVGTVEPRKGQAQVLRAFELLWRDGIDANLVIVGKQGWMVESLVGRLRQHSELNKRLFWLEGISDEYLGKLYAVSTCLIAASEGEGFGLPLIEAAQHKLPIIARDIPVFREVAEEHAFYFKGLEPQDLMEAVKKWIELDKQGKSPRSDKMKWLTWKQSAKQLTKVVLDGCRQSAEVVLVLRTGNRDL